MLFEFDPCLEKGSCHHHHYYYYYYYYESNKKNMMMKDVHVHVRNDQELKG